MIKGNELGVVDIVFEILIKKEFKFFCFILLSAFLITLELDIRFLQGLHQNVTFVSCQ